MVWGGALKRWSFMDECEWSKTIVTGAWGFMTGLDNCINKLLHSAAVSRLAERFSFINACVIVGPVPRNASLTLLYSNLIFANVAAHHLNTNNCRLVRTLPAAYYGLVFLLPALCSLRVLPRGCGNIQVAANTFEVLPWRFSTDEEFRYLMLLNAPSSSLSGVLTGYIRWDFSIDRWAFINASCCFLRNNQLW